MAMAMAIINLLPTTPQHILPIPHIPHCKKFDVLHWPAVEGCHVDQVVNSESELRLLQRIFFVANTEMCLNGVDIRQKTLLKLIYLRSSRWVYMRRPTCVGGLCGEVVY
jgi:hypothetical protein